MATYYADSELGNNANNGTSWALAKQSLAAAWGLCSTGDTIVCRAGSMFQPLSGEGRMMVSYINLNDFTIRTESRIASDNDLIGKNLWEAAWWGLVIEPPTATGWAHVGNGTTIPIGTWSKVLCNNAPNGSSGSVKVERLWLGCRLNGPGTRRDQLVVGTAYDYARSLTELGFQWPWYATSGTDSDMTLYVYTGSTTIAPPQYYNGLACINPNNTPGATTGGSLRGFIARNFTGIIRIQQMCVYGASTGDFGIDSPSSATTGVMILDRTVSRMCAGTSVGVIGTVGFPAAGGVYAYSPKNYQMGAPQEYTYPLPSWRQRYEFFSCGAYASNCIMYNGISDDPGHGYASFGAATWASRPQNCHAIGGLATYSPWLSDGHPYAMHAAENCSVRGVRFLGCATAGHIGGVRNILSNCYFVPRTNILENNESKFVTDIRNINNKCPAMSNSQARHNTYDLSAMSPTFTLAAVGFLSAAADERIDPNCVAVYNNLFILPSGIAGVAMAAGSGGTYNPLNSPGIGTLDYIQQVFNNRTVIADDTNGELVVCTALTNALPRTFFAYNDTTIISGAAGNARSPKASNTFGPYALPAASSAIVGAGSAAQSATGFTALLNNSLDQSGRPRRSPPTVGYLEPAGY